MNYIQRLFDAASPAPGAASMPVAPPTIASSPVMAADQRLGIFPDLAAPFDPVPQAGADSHEQAITPDAPPPRRPATKADTGTPQPRPRAVTAPTPAEARQTAPQPTEAAAQTPPPADPAPSGPVSALQRLVESDPLPDPRSPRPARKPDSQPFAAAEVGAPPIVAAPPRPPEPSPVLPFPPNPAVITPDQFTPRDSAPPAPPEIAPHPQPDRPAPLPEPPPPSAEPKRAPPPSAPRLEPSASQAASPFARQPDLPLPPPPPPSAREAPPPPAPERIVERIREVPVAPAPPPKAATAAAQSVIGPLGSRRSFGWQPRQGGV